MNPASKPKNGQTRRLPMVPLRDDVIFPRVIVPLSAGRPTSVAALEAAMAGEKALFLVTQRDAQVDDVTEADVYTVGVVAELSGMRRIQNGPVQFLVGGIARARLHRFTQTRPYLEVEVDLFDDEVSAGVELEALARQVKSAYRQYVEAGASIGQDVAASILKSDDPGYLSDLVGSSPDLTAEQKQHLLETPNVAERLRFLSVFLAKQIEILQLKAKIQSEVQSTINKAQKEQILREQMKAIRKELGEDEEGSELQQLRTKVEAAGMPDLVKERALKEIGRLESIPTASPEVGIIRTYVDWLVSLPWKVAETEGWDIQKAAQVLDEDHYGVEKVKERIIEYMAVRQRSLNLRSPILCFVGPPGVGKTSLGKSIARALGRKFVRLSLGGIRDEAEVRGHRRTYIGAMPGRIIQNMKTAGVKNPVFMLDEIDKVGADWRGDPSSALLEVLDPEQNREFSDHYLEVPYDLSQVLFITTANVVDPIIAPLRDRMEIIRLPGYIEEEKLHIAQKFLVPRTLKEHGITDEHLRFPDETVRALIREYTHEAGVRNLEREIANIARKIPRRLAEGKTDRVEPKPEDLPTYLGPSRFEFGLAEETDLVGAATGVSVSEYGGDVITVEALVMEGKADFVMTGQLGKVMEESARAALSYARAHAGDYRLNGEFFDAHMVHIHVPAGAIPKDGPSAGVTMTTAIVSALSGRPVRRDVAMTGEITLRGKVLPIGGVKEKLLAAHRAGIKIFILPDKNKKDLVDIPQEVRDQMEIVLVGHVDEVLAKALLPGVPGKAPRRLGYQPPVVIEPAQPSGPI
jgi:ATP-dependent Lon protease